MRDERLSEGGRPTDLTGVPAPPPEIETLPGAAPRSPGPMSFASLRAADWVAFIAALALLFVSAVDWYSTVAGDEARRIQGLSDPAGALGGEVERRGAGGCARRGARAPRRTPGR